jgi:hypothetical protein
MTLIYESMDWSPLIKSKQKTIQVGTIFRFPPCDYFAGESIIEIIMCTSHEEHSIFEFYCISGYKSGRKIGFIPRDCYPDVSADNLKLSWLLKNWYKFVYPESNLHDVYISRRNAALKIPTNDTKRCA